MKVIIELEFNQTPSQEDVYDYLNALMNDGCLDWYVQEENNTLEKDQLLPQLLPLLKNLYAEVDSDVDSDYRTNHLNLAMEEVSYFLKSIKEEK